MASGLPDVDEEIMRVAVRAFMDNVYLCSQRGHKNMLDSLGKLLRNYTNGFISEKQVYNSVKYDLFADHPDLLEDFERIFLKRKTSNQVGPNSCKKKGKSSGHHNKIGANGEGEQVKGEISDKRGYKMTREELEVKQNQYTKEMENDTNGDEYTLTRIDLWSFETCTPSYRFLPKNYPISISTERSKNDNEVLNDYVRLIAPEISGQSRQKSKDELARDVLDDDQYEQDMFFEYAKSAAKNIEALLRNIQMEELNLKTQPICIEKHLTPQNLRCIKGLYGEHGLDIMEMISMNPSEALCVILCRLKKKIKEMHRNDFS